MICRCRLVKPTVSKSTMPRRPMPAAARYSPSGEQRPPAPMSRMPASFSFRCPPMPTSGIIRGRLDLQNSSDRRGRQVQPERRAEATGPDEQDAGILQLALPLDADLRHNQVPAVPQYFFSTQIRHVSLAWFTVNGVPFTVAPYTVHG